MKVVGRVCGNATVQCKQVACMMVADKFSPRSNKGGEHFRGPQVTKRQQQRSHVAKSGTSERVDKEFVEELNRVSNNTLEVLAVGDEDAALRLSSELQEMREFLEEVNDRESSQFLGVLQSFLDHRVPKELNNLQGLYARATDRILNQVSGSSWKLVEEGSENAEEPKFSTWEDVMNGQKSSTAATGRDVKDMSLYRLLGVEATAEQGEIKSAFRKLALKMHPDVNDAPDANDQFAAISKAYDVLSDPETRQLYNEVGLTVAGDQTPASRKGNARKAWDEFKPYIRQNKHTRARASSQQQTSVQSEQPPGQDSLDPESAVPLQQNDARKEAAPGDVVEYPLRAIEIEGFNDGRSHGVGLLVGRNKDRGDAKTLPEDQLSLCEIESLRQEEPDSDRWIADELGITSFARLEDMQVVAVTDFDSRHDVWTINAASLSPGCGGPPLPEEVIL